LTPTVKKDLKAKDQSRSEFRAALICGRSLPRVVSIGRSQRQVRRLERSCETGRRFRQNRGDVSLKAMCMRGRFGRKLFWKVGLTFLNDVAILNMESKLSIRTGGDALKNRLEELRKQRGVTQEELAEILEVSRQTIGSLENGRYSPSIILAFKIARFFKMRIEEIFIYEEDPK
jgi:putative transcriptional regulator